MEQKLITFSVSGISLKDVTSKLDYLLEEGWRINKFSISATTQKDTIYRIVGVLLERDDTKS